MVTRVVHIKPITTRLWSIYTVVGPEFNRTMPVADPGFPRGGGANYPGGAPTYDFAKIFQKLHEIERIWTLKGGARPSRPPLDPPLNA